MYFEDEDIPALIPIKSKMKKPVNLAPQQQDMFEEDLFKNMVQKFQQVNPDNETEKVQQVKKPMPNQQRMDQYEKKYANIYQKGRGSQISFDKSAKSVASKKEKQIQKAKFMMNDMLKRIEAKNISEELRPIKNEVILDKIKELEIQMEQLKIDAQNKENSLITNPNNQLLRNELNTIKREIDKSVTIKELYNQKINLRNKVYCLESTIITLKDQNQNLTIKVHQDQDANQKQAMGLATQKEQELRDQLRKCKIDLKKVTAIKQQLQNNVNDIIQSFRRLYEQAETARVIVVGKLKQIQLKEKNSDFEKSESQKRSIISFVNQDKSKRVNQNRDTSNIQLRKTARPTQLYPTTDKYSPKPKTSMQDQIKKMKGSQYGYNRR